MNVPAMRLEVRLVTMTVPAAPLSGVCQIAEPSVHEAMPPKFEMLTPSGYVPGPEML